jgi:TPP-dependent pyruvate/acetoin dehydrogenase alpha subunit
VMIATSNAAASQSSASGEGSSAENSKWLRAYRQMVRIRLFEEQVNELYTSALMPGLAHLYSGEEAIAVGICEALNIDDYITSTHRGHGHCLAKGATPDRMFAELLGKRAGYCKGKGGSMHIADPATGNLGANAIVGGSVGIATGAAFSAKHKGNGRVAICFFGEGALGQGSLYEVMNLAQLWKLPVIYVCENNMYNEYTHFSETTAGTILGRAAAFGLDAASVDGPDVRAVNEVASPAPALRSYKRILIAIAAITSATSIANTIARNRKSSTGRVSAIPSSCTPNGCWRKTTPTLRRSKQSLPKRAPRWKPP